jgi:hypothetical protein
VQNGDQFVNQAIQIKESFQQFEELIIDMVEFTMESLRVLTEMPRDVAEVKVLLFSFKSNYFGILIIS